MLPDVTFVLRPASGAGRYEEDIGALPEQAAGFATALRRSVSMRDG